MPPGANASISVNGKLRFYTCMLDSADRSAIYFAIDNKNLEMVKILVENNGFDGKAFVVRAGFVASQSASCSISERMRSP